MKQDRFVVFACKQKHFIPVRTISLACALFGITGMGDFFYQILVLKLMQTYFIR